MRIRGIEGMQASELNHELQRGGKFVHFNYCASIVILTFKRPSDIYFVRSGENPLMKGLPFSLISLVAGWWGIPWGPIYTVQSLYRNFNGGRDVTAEVVNSLRSPAKSPTTACASIPTPVGR